MQKLIVIFFLALPLTLIAGNDTEYEAGVKAFEQGDFANAVDSLVQFSGTNPLNVEARILLGRSYLESGDLNAAKDQFEQATDLDPKRAEAHHWVGVSYGQLASNASLFKAGAYAKKSLRGFETALALDPEYIAAHQGMVEYRIHSPRLFGGGKTEAIKAAAALREIDEFEGRFALADIYQRMDMSDESIAEFAALTERYPDDPRAHFRLGLLRLAEEDYAQAHQLFSRAAVGVARNEQADEAMKGALYQVGRTAVFSENHIDEGIQAFEKYLSLPLNSNLPEKAWAHYRLGTLLELKGRSAEAQPHFDAATSTEDKDLIRLLDKK